MEKVEDSDIIIKKNLTNFTKDQKIKSKSNIYIYIYIYIYVQICFPKNSIFDEIITKYL